MAKVNIVPILLANTVNHNRWMRWPYIQATVCAEANWPSQP
jgi:hypothetical protein